MIDLNRISYESALESDIPHEFSSRTVYNKHIRKIEQIPNILQNKITISEETIQYDMFDLPDFKIMQFRWDFKRGYSKDLYFFYPKNVNLEEYLISIIPEFRFLGYITNKDVEISVGLDIYKEPFKEDSFHSACFDIIFLNQSIRMRENELIEISDEILNSSDEEEWVPVEEKEIYSLNIMVAGLFTLAAIYNLFLAALESSIEHLFYVLICTLVSTLMFWLPNMEININKMQIKKNF